MGLLTKGASLEQCDRHGYLRSFVGIRPELKWFINKKPKSKGYIGLSGLLNYSSANRSGVGITGEEVDGFSVLYQRVHQKEWRAGALFNFGLILGTKGTFYKEIYINLGRSFRKVYFDNFSNPSMVEDSDYDYQCGTSVNLDSKAKLHPELYLGFKLGFWRFRGDASSR